MGLMDILQQYAGNAAGQPANDQSHEHFDQVAAGAPREVVGQGVADAFRSNNTPPFAQMVAQMFGQSNPNQRAGVLNQLLSSLGPGALTGVGGGTLGRLLGMSGTTQVTPDQAAQVTPEQAQEIASHAEKHDPGVVDRVGGFYAEHPQIVKTLGSAAIAIALASVANRMRR